MEFGRLPAEALDTVDFSFPKEPKENDALLKKIKKGTKTHLYIGCAKWGRKEWVGKIFPRGTKEGDYLTHYAKFFNSIELNATFYKLPSRQQTEAWRAKVPDSFRFCPKVTDQISHLKRLKNIEEYTERFIEGISGFGETLGPVFLMPHPQMGPKTMDTIEAFLESLPDDLTVFVEVRHTEWFSNRANFDQLTSVLRRRKAGLAVTDVAGRRDVLHLDLTIPKAFIRFVGNGLHPTDYTRADDWANQLIQWKNKGVQEIYFFMHQHNELHAPMLNQYVIQKLNEIEPGTYPKLSFLDEHKTTLF